ncbi:MAG: family 78 glycoside hydrolase catalytic domain [Clostridia bacterium]|nr:family 78 glycoside hydrolase catalytic domain [Clostridia bacterium]
MGHRFTGKWITDDEFYALKPRNVFHRQLDKRDLPCDEHRNRHILFRKRFYCDGGSKNAKVYISADDYYKLYINGQFVAQGPAPSYHFNYNYNVLEVGEYLREGENLIAVHTLYQGLINRVWQSGDQRHGLILDLTVDGRTVVSSDESFKTRPHSAFTETGVTGKHQTQFLEQYDSNAAEVGFERPDFDDSDWENARMNRYDDHTLAEQRSKMLVFERVRPVKLEREAGRILYDFGSNYVGYLCVTAEGKRGDTVTVRCGQELNGDGSLRYDLRAYCTYDENWVLSDGVSVLDQFDYKSFRYAELLIPEGVTVREVYFAVRHYPFTLKTRLKPQFDNEELRKIWSLCVHTQQYGVQEVIQDCMDREKGFYLGDGCYTALTNMILTGDDSMVRKLIDDAFSTTFITETLVTCMCCSFMQEIAEYPLILVYLVLWHYNLTGDKEYLEQNFKKVTDLLDAYRREYERDGLLRDVDKWCVVEWPKNFQHGYDVDVREGKVCEEPHVSLNAYYLAAVRTANRIASILNEEQYRDEAPLLSAFYNAFYDEQRALFKDGESTAHISLVGNSFVYGLGLCTDQGFQQNFLAMLEQHKISSLSLFCTFLVLMGLTLNGREELIERCLLDEGAWKRILREDGTTTFEGWGKETKKNASLFHLTMSYAAIFMADIDLKKLF